MTYEICKRSVATGSELWFTVAWTDIWSYAQEIVIGLSYAGTGIYAVLKDGEVVFTV